MVSKPAADNVAPVGRAEVAWASTVLAVAATPASVSLDSRSPLPTVAKLKESPSAWMTAGGTVIKASVLAQLLVLAVSQMR